MINKQGQKVGPKRGNRQRFPYEPRVVGGRLLRPAELQAIHRYVVQTPVLENVTEEIRAVIEAVWPELIPKLPPIRILSAEPEPPQIVPCTHCRGTGHNEPATRSPMHDKALRPNNRKPDATKEWFDLWRNSR